MKAELVGGPRDGQLIDVHDPPPDAWFLMEEPPIIEPILNEEGLIERLDLPTQVRYERAEWITWRGARKLKDHSTSMVGS